MEQTDLLEILSWIDPAELSYQEWISVGMGLHQAGYTAQDWEDWSRRDSERYHPGECARKWNSFHGAGTPVTAGTIVQIARERGWKPPRIEGGFELGWGDTIGPGTDQVVVDHAWLEGREVTEPDRWDPVKELTTYLETLFEAGENVGYVTESWEK